MLKRVGALIAFLIVTSTASAQETYSVPATAPQVTKLSKSISRINTNVCARFGLIATCTQAQACTAAGAPGGASCTANQAQQANVRIYPDTQPGREELVQQLAKNGFTNLDSSVTSFDNAEWCKKFKAATQPEKDAACTSVGYVAGCEPCQ